MPSLVMFLERKNNQNALNTVVALTFIRALIIIWETFLPVRDKCKIISVRQNEKYLYYKVHGLFFNFPVVIDVKS